MRKSGVQAKPPRTETATQGGKSNLAMHPSAQVDRLKSQDISSPSLSPFFPASALHAHRGHFAHDKAINIAKPIHAYLGKSW